VLEFTVRVVRTKRKHGHRTRVEKAKHTRRPRSCDSWSRLRGGHGVRNCATRTRVFEISVVGTIAENRSTYTQRRSDNGRADVHEVTTVRARRRTQHGRGGCRRFDPRQPTTSGLGDDDEINDRRGDDDGGGGGVVRVRDAAYRPISVITATGAERCRLLSVGYSAKTRTHRWGVTLPAGCSRSHENR